MKQQYTAALRPAWAALGLLALATTAGAQPFTYGNTDLCLTFRSVVADSYEVVVDLGPASTYVNAAPGSTNLVTAYTATQLGYPTFPHGSTFPDFDNLNWAVVGGYVSGAGYPGYPAYTLWLTVPRDPSNPAAQSAPARRHHFAEQVGPQLEINSILANAAGISSAIGSSSTYNTATFVRESTTTYASRCLKNFMQSQATPSFGSLNDTWSDNNLENQTAQDPNGLFTDSGDVMRSDLYEIRPLDDVYGTAVVDPHTGVTGQAYYVGYFELASNGSMTFVRSAVTGPTPPPPPQLSISKVGNVNTISFVSSNTASYTLCFTNAAGLRAAVSTWPTGPSLIGNGTRQSLQDTTTDPVRFYRVKAQ